MRDKFGVNFGFFSLKLSLARRVVAIAFALSSIWIFPLSDACTSGKNFLTASSYNYGRRDVIGCGNMIANTAANRQAILARNVNPCFEPRLLSGKTTHLWYDVTISCDTGFPNISLTKKVASNLADEFYCEQAIWESLPLDQKITSDVDGRLEFKSSSRGRTTSLNQIRNDRNVFVKMHFVPASVNKRLLKPIDVDSEDNLMLFKASLVHDSQLTEFRKTWVSFIGDHSRLSQSELDDEKQSLLKKFHNLFFHP